MTGSIKSNKAVVVIPLYKERPSAWDLFSIRQCVAVLGDDFDIYAVKPRGLSMQWYLPFFDGSESFDPSCFRNVNAYNKLMLSPLFYKRFLGYEYILIYQTDALVFRNDLLYWCNQNFDYIGAPWRYTSYPNTLIAAFENWLNDLHWRYNIKQWNSGLPTERQLINKVGNGGFSLRKVGLFYELCQTNVPVIEHYNSQLSHYFNEDVFWGIELNRKRQTLSIPNSRTAIRFSIENGPESALRDLDGKLPFGCHAWDKNIDTWRPVFKKHNLTLPERMNALLEQSL